MIFDTSIGIKQVIRYEWMDYVVNLLKLGLSEKEIRKELEFFLADRRGNGEIGDRAKYTMSLAVTLLMNIWVTPKPELICFRDRLLELINNEKTNFICHWAIVSSVYPFWFNMSYIFGSLFRLQNQIKKEQVINRTYDLLGERNTIERCSRYVIRSFASWGIILDMEKPGIYEKGKNLEVSDLNMASLLVEAMLNALPEGRIPLDSIINYPAFFNFTFPTLDGFSIAKTSPNLHIEQYSVDNIFLLLKKKTDPKSIK